MGSFNVYEAGAMPDPSLQQIFQNAAVGIATTSREGRFLKVNPKFAEMIGYGVDELTSMTFHDLTHPDDLSLSNRWTVDLVERRQANLIGEKRYIHKQGHILWLRLNINPVRNARDEVDFYVTAFEDITERKLSEDLLRDQREVLELMAKNLPLDATLARIVKLIEDQAPGALSTIYLVEDGKLWLGAAPSFPESFVRTVNGCPIGPEAGSCGAAAHFGRRMVSTNIREEKEPIWGPFRDWILSYGIQAAWSTPVIGKNEEVLGTVSMCWREPKNPTRRHFELVDVATRLMGIAIERDRTDKLLREQQAKMITSSKLAALGEMAGGLAHEINNPLAIIKAQATLLSMMVNQGRLESGLLKESAQSIENTTERISKIIKGLRTFARETDSEEIARLPLNALIEETLVFCRERFKNQTVRLEIPPIPSDCLIECRPVQMSQVLLNLLNNSHDATEALSEKWIRIESEETADQLILSVTDSGTGIPEEIRDRIMQPFFTTKAVNRGTGLGLSISAGIVSSHGGRLWLDESSPNTRFVITLPKTQETRK